MRSIAHILTVVLAAGAPAFAQPASQPSNPPAVTPQPGLPAAADLFERCITASGGEAKIRSITSRKITGLLKDVKTGRAVARLTLFRAAPDKSLTLRDVPGSGVTEVGFNGSVAWMKDPAGKVSILNESETTAQREASSFYGEVDYKTLYSEITTVEKLTFEGQPAYRVQYVSRSGGTGSLMFSDETGLVIGAITDRKASQGGSISVTAILSDFKDVDGVKYAHRVVQRVGANEVEITFDSVQHNPADLPSFDPPKPASPSGG